MDKKPKVLIVEDEVDMLKVLTMRLRINGFNVITASDGEEGIKKAREEKPNLILLDLMLPKITGYEVCRMLKFDDNCKKIPIVVLSALQQQAEKDKVIECGADAFFAKPFNLESLLDKIRSLAY